MSAQLDDLSLKLKQLSVADLLSLQEQIIAELRTKTLSNGNGNKQEATPSDWVPGFYRPSAEEVEAELAAIFTPEELAEINQMKAENLNLPPLPKTLAEIISEDREDRF